MHGPAWRSFPPLFGTFLGSLLSVACTSPSTHNSLELTLQGKKPQKSADAKALSSAGNGVTRDALRPVVASNNAKSGSAQRPARFDRQPLENMAVAQQFPLPAESVVAERSATENDGDDLEPVVDSGLEPVGEATNDNSSDLETSELETPTPAIENAFGLCDGSIYVSEWSAQFDARWQRENGKRFKRASQARKALAEARSEAFLQLLFPLLKDIESDFPVAVNGDVLKWISYFQTRGRNAFVTWLRRAQDVVPKITPVLEEHGLPKDLVYLAMIESGFNNKALSTAKAVGTWQFIRATGRRYGLRIDDYVDERRDPSKSARAAAQYLTDLYTMFGDWHLATASYNAGEGRVARAVRRASDPDGSFFDLADAGRLPKETANYVPKIIAALLISKAPKKFGFEVTAGSRAMDYQFIEIDRSIALADLSKELSLDAVVLENLNPELRLGITPPGRKGEFYQLRVPTALSGEALAAVDTLPEPSNQHVVVAKVQRRESLAQFARRHGLSLKTVAEANPGISRVALLQRGQSLSIPVKLGSGQYERLIQDSRPSKKSPRRWSRSRRSQASVRLPAATPVRLSRSNNASNQARPAGKTRSDSAKR